MRKSKTIPSLLLAAAAAFAVTACTKADRAEVADDAREAYQETKAAVSRGWNDVKSYSYEKRDDFTREMKARQAEFEADLSKVKSEYSEARASASRKAAWEELKNAEANYKDKLNALGTASSATWDAARDDVVAAWDRLQAAYAQARAD